MGGPDPMPRPKAPGRNPHRAGDPSVSARPSRRKRTTSSPWTCERATPWGGEWVGRPKPNSDKTIRKTNKKRRESYSASHVFTIMLHSELNLLFSRLMTIVGRCRCIANLLGTEDGDL